MNKYDVTYILRLHYNEIEAENEKDAVYIADEYYMQEDLTGTLSDPDVEVKQIH